jgi:hypothetical protein
VPDQANPYESPRETADAVKTLLNSVPVSETMVFYLRGAAPWLRFLGILGFIGCGILAAVGVLMRVLLPGLDMNWASLEILTGSIMPLVYIIIGIVGIFPARYTYNFGARIRNFLRTNAEFELELALKNNKSLWKFYGIMAMISIALIPLVMVISLILWESSFLQ